MTSVVVLLGAISVYLACHACCIEYSPAVGSSDWFERWKTLARVVVVKYGGMHDKDVPGR